MRTYDNIFMNEEDAEKKDKYANMLWWYQFSALWLGKTSILWIVKLQFCQLGKCLKSCGLVKLWVRKVCEYMQVWFAYITLTYFSHEIRIYSETLNNEYIERILQMSYSSLSDNGMLQIFSFLNKCLDGAFKTVPAY